MMPGPFGSERSSAWLERQLWELDVAGSNPVAPTILILRSSLRVDVIHCMVECEVDSVNTEVTPPGAVRTDSP
jgi:hypothetical protein